MASGKITLMFSLVVLLSYLFCETKGHFLSIEDLEEFYDLEEKLVSTFTTYIEEQKQILEVVKQRYEEQKRWQPVFNDTNVYLSNPLNVHAMLKRLVSDWPITLALLGGFEDEEDDEPLKLPSIKEYQASVHGIARLYQVYNYTVKEIVSGSVFPGTDNTSVLTADDCLTVGKDFYENKHYQLAIEWFKEALDQAKNQTEGGKFVATNTASDQASVLPLENAYEYLALATCFTGDQRQSKKYFNKLYSEFPEFRPTQDLIKDHLLAINDTCRKLINNESLKPKDHKLDLSWREDASLSADYARLCQAETTPVSPQPLMCWLTDWDHPYWILQPIKMEDLHYNPSVYLVYDAISPAERQFITENMINDEKIMSLSGFVYEFWQPLPPNSSVSESLVRRTDYISMGTVHNTQEQVLISSMPAGAEYVVNKDFDLKIPEPSKYRAGSATYFLDEPQAGGLMVFPRLELSVTPIAGAALVWFNVDKEGKVDQRSVYGVCPVIQGHQTTLTLWFKQE